MSLQKNLSCITAIGLAIFSPADGLAQEHSTLWGVDGEDWDPEISQLRDFTLGGGQGIGYQGTAAALPNWPEGVDITDYGAVPDDNSSDVAALLAAIAACPPNHAVFLPDGTYIIDDIIDVTPDNIVIRGESRDGTILFFPKRLMEIYPGLDADTFETGFYLNAFIQFSRGSHRGIEDLSLVFRDETKGTGYVRPNRPKQQAPHWFWVGANAIAFGEREENSWVRNIYIKNSNHAVRISQSSYITILDVVIDQFAERVANGRLASGHMGLWYQGAQNCLIHNIRFTGLWVHDNCAMGTSYNVFSRISSDVSLRLDHHAMGNQYNLYTEIDTGEGGRGYGGGGISHNYRQTYWGIHGALEADYLPTDREATMVGIETSAPTDIGATWHHETLDPELLAPANIWLAQMAYHEDPRVPADKVLTIPHDETKPVRLLASADTYVDSTEPTNNFGRVDQTLSLQNGERESYLQFDLRELDQTAAGAVKLRVLGNRAWGGTLQVEAVTDDAWSEHQMNWNDKPAAGTVLATTVVDTPGVWHTVDITSFVNSQLAGDKIVSLKLSESGTSNEMLVMPSRPDGTSPQIVLYPDASTVPPPAAPIGLSANQGAGDVVQLDWDDNAETDLASYNLYRKTATEDFKIWAMGLTASEYEDHVVASNAAYSYRVTAVDTAGTESPESSEVFITVIHPDAPAAPNSLSATASNSAVFLDWDDNSEPDLASYSVFRGTTSTNYTTELASGLSSSEYIDGTAVNGTTYFYFVAAIDNDGYLSAKSFEVSATPSNALPDTTAPLAPVNLTVTGVGGGSVSLEWGGNSEADLSGYTVYRSTTSGTYGSPLATDVIATGYTDASVSAGTTYYYVVSASDANNNESGLSNEVSTRDVLVAFEVGQSWRSDDFPTLPTLTSTDLANSIPVETDFSGSLELTPTDGLLGGDDFDLTAPNESGTARYVIDLGSLQNLGSVNSYSYGEKNSNRTLQTFSLYGSPSDTTGTAAEFDETDPAWTLIATVDATGVPVPNSDFYGVSSISGINADYRELMWVASEPDGFAHSVWKEFDVRAPTATPYELWASTEGVGLATNDFDSDGLSNLFEYAFDGDPTDSLNQGTLPTLNKSGNLLIYVHPKRSDDPNLLYTVETTTDLLSVPWSSEGHRVTGTSVTGETLDFVTNEIDIDEDQKFIRLKVEQQ